MLTRQRVVPDWQNKRGEAEEELVLSMRHTMNKAHCDESLLHQHNWTVWGVATIGSISPVLNEARYLHMSGPIVVMGPGGNPARVIERFVTHEYELLCSELLIYVHDI